MELEQLPTPRQDTSKYWVASGGGLLALSVFLPGVHVIIFGDLTLMQLAQLGHTESSAWLVVIAGGGAALVALGFDEKISLRLWTSFGAAGLGLYEGINLIHSLNKYNAFVQVQLGAYAAIFAGLFLIAGMLITRKEHL